MNSNTKPTSRRQRIYDLMKTTKDVYIPSISNTISNLATEGRGALTSDGSATDSPVPRDLTGVDIEIYPHFTRHVVETVDDSEQSVYYTQAHGWVYSTAGSLRKKKLVLALARQYVKSKNTAVSEITANEMNEQINSINDQESVFSETNKSRPGSSTNLNDSFDPNQSFSRTGTSISDSSSIASSTLTSSSDFDDVLRERVANFVNKSMGNLEITICIGSADRTEIKHLITDDNGNFNIDIPTSFEPSYIQVSVTEDEKIFAFKNTIFPGSSKYAIISDIDDTIKKTGVCGEKRQLFRNTFTGHVTTWEIPGAADCYRFFSQQYQMPVFYVSNAPYQLYVHLIKFFDYFEFPQGSMYLKKYTGNIMNSIWEPSHTRKKDPLGRILTHFNDRKFFLIGDTGEQDLEAYVDVARLNPDKIQAIYLRVAEGSIHSETLRTLREIISKKEEEYHLNPGESSIEENLIDLDTNLSVEHLVKIEKESEEISSKVLTNSLDLEQGKSNDFFPKTQSEPSSSEDSTSAPLKPQRKSPPPAVPKKPEFLKSKVIPHSASSQIDEVSSNNTQNSHDLHKEVNEIKDNPPQLPRLPKRPVPTPPALPARRSAATPISQVKPPSNQTNIPFDEEVNDLWMSRILTSLIILRKVNPEIKLKLFVDFSEVQLEIKKYVK